MFLPSLEARHQQHPHHTFTCTPQGLSGGGPAQQHSPGLKSSPALPREAPATSAISQSAQTPSVSSGVAGASDATHAGVEHVEGLDSNSAGL